MRATSYLRVTSLARHAWRVVARAQRYQILARSLARNDYRMDAVGAIRNDQEISDPTAITAVAQVYRAKKEKRVAELKILNAMREAPGQTAEAPGRDGRGPDYSAVEYENSPGTRSCTEPRGRTSCERTRLEPTK